MSTFVKKDSKPVDAALDPHRYVNYTLGMLLGVDDFKQEHAYLSGYDHWLAREQLGYGTASGLNVSVDLDPQRGPRVLVDSGVAVSPRGELIRVTPAQCAYLNDWLAANKDQLDQAGVKIDIPLTTYVVLSYRACASDSVPVAGEPCRSEDDLMQASRLNDDFTLDLRLQVPEQREEEALRCFVDWLRQVRVAGVSMQEVGNAQGDQSGQDGQSEQDEQGQQDKQDGQNEQSPQSNADNTAPNDQGDTGKENGGGDGSNESNGSKRDNTDDKGDESDQDNFTTLDDFIEAIRNAASASDPAQPAEFMIEPGAPPIDIVIPADDACEYWKTAFRLWVTELRPAWRAKCSSGDVPDEGSVLLAELTMSLAQSPTGERVIAMPEGTDVIDAVNVNQENRPYLLHLRLLQEWMLCGRREIPPSDDVVPQVTFGLAPDAGTMDSYSRADHTHGTPGLGGDVSSNEDGTVTVQGILNIPIDSSVPIEDGQMLMYNADKNLWEAVDLDEDVDVDINIDLDDDEKRRRGRRRHRQHHEHHDEHHDEHHEHHENHDHDDIIISGDVTRNDNGSITVQGLRNVPVADKAPTGAGQVLMYDGTQWEAAYLPDLTSLPYVEHMGPTRYRIAAAGWVHCDGQSEQQSYNGLRAEARRNQSILIQFDGYEWPIYHPYIVKVLPGLHHTRRPAFIHFDRFIQEGIVLRVYDGQGTPFGYDDLIQMSVMVEVSQYILNSNPIDEVDTQPNLPLPSM